MNDKLDKQIEKNGILSNEISECRNELNDLKEKAANDLEEQERFSREQLFVSAETEDVFARIINDLKKGSDNYINSHLSNNITL